MTGRLLKVEASGNDFVLAVGDLATRLAAGRALAERLCDRRRGIGADGALAVEAAGAGRARLTYRNADGSRARFCGNGSRCAARAAVELLGLPPRLVLETDWAPIPAEIDGATVALELPSPAPARALELEVGAEHWSGWLVEVGVPHLVLPVADVAAIDLDRVAPPLRSHRLVGPDGANVSFVAAGDGGPLAIRTWERGVEGETLCCGSAAVAAGLIEMAARPARRVVVRPRSGDELTVEATVDGIRFTGETRFVAEILPIELNVGS